MYRFQRVFFLSVVSGLAGLAAFQSLPAGAAPLDRYVSPQGDDQHAGTAEAPFATLAGSRDGLRRERQAKPGRSIGPVTVWIHGGLYELPESLLFDAGDGGGAEAPVVFRAVPGEKVTLTGGRLLPPDAFRPVGDSAGDRIDPEAREHVSVVDLKGLGITAYGEFPDHFEAPPAIAELFYKEERMTLARWPNQQEWASVADVIDSGPAPWRNVTSEGTGTFTYSGDRPNRWKTAPAVWLCGYWCFDWAGETIRIGSIDYENRRITLAHPHVYGIGSGNSGERRFCAVNLLEELDTPGEYYLDREKGTLYFWPPGPIGPGDVVLSTITEPLIRCAEAAYLTFRDLNIACTAGDGIAVRGGSHILIEGCTVTHTGLAGIRVEQGDHHRVAACTIRENGTSGLIMEGGDRKTLSPCGHEAVNNHIGPVARRQRTHAYNVHLGGVGVRLANNLLHDAPHQAIGLGGNNHLIEYNEIHHVGLESDDCGAFYMGRNPSERGSILRYNYWHDTGGPRSHGSCAVYFDDGAGGQTVFGNIFVRAAGGSFGAVFVHGGHDNFVKNNIFVDCRMAIRQVRWKDELWKEWLEGDLWKERLLKEVDITKPPYSEQYPELSGFLAFHGEPRMNRAERNLVVHCGDFIEGDWIEKDNWVTPEDPGFVDIAGGDYRLKPESIAFSKIPGFEAIPADRIGPFRNSPESPSAP